MTKTKTAHSVNVACIKTHSMDSLERLKKSETGLFVPRAKPTVGTMKENILKPWQ